MSEKPEPIRKLEERDKRIYQAIQSARLASTQAKLAGEEKLVDESGSPDYGKLQDKEVQDESIDAMVESYASAATKHFRVEDTPVDDPDFYEDLVKEFTGLTRDELEKHMRTHEDKFFDVFYEQVHDNVISRLERQLRPYAHDHIGEEHIDDLVEHMDSEVDYDSDMLKPRQAAVLYNMHQSRGPVSEEVVEDLPDYLIKDAA